MEKRDCIAGSREAANFAKHSERPGGLKEKIYVNDPEILTGIKKKLGGRNENKKPLPI